MTPRNAQLAALVACVVLALLALASFWWSWQLSKRFCYPWNFIKVTVHPDLRVSWEFASPNIVNATIRRPGIGQYVELLEQSIRSRPDLFRLDAECSFLVNVFDGHRERIPHYSNLLPIQKDVIADSGDHAWRIELRAEAGELPVFPLPVFAFCAHDNDTSVALLPDLYMSRDDGISKLEARLDGKLLPFLDRTPSLIWRGGPHGDARRFMFGPGATLWNHSDLLDIRSDDPKPMHEIANYQFQLDVDGEVSAWDALRWKLLSGSLVIKLRSHWKQWFYDSFIPDVHYVEITSLDQLDPTVRYYLNHIDEARQIGERGRAFALASCKTWRPRLLSPYPRGIDAQC
jgi:hypothetical protein